MKRLKSVKLGRTSDGRDVCAVCRIEDRHTRVRKKVVFSYEAVKNMLDGHGEIAAKDGSIISIDELCNPGGERDYGWLVSLVLNYAWSSGVITWDEYREKVREHFEDYYLERYLTMSKMCPDFYNRYFSQESKTLFRSYERMFRPYAEVIEEVGNRVPIRIGGKFEGCYYDDQDRLRPRTSKVKKKEIVPVAEKLWVCFVMETVRAPFPKAC